MPKRQLILTPEEAQQLAQDLTLIAAAAARPEEGVSRTMVEQIWAYESFFDGEEDATWPTPMDHTTAHQSSCERCGKIDATVRLREIQHTIPKDGDVVRTSWGLCRSRAEWRCDECDVNPMLLPREPNAEQGNALIAAFQATNAALGGSGG